MKSPLENLLAAALQSLQGTILNAPVAPGSIVVERTRDAGHGDFSTNIAMRLARAAGKPPRELAQLIVAALPADPLREWQVRLLGPASAAMARRAGRHHAQLVIESAERGSLQRFLHAWVPRLEALPGGRGVRWLLDVDPLETQ